MKYDVMLVDDQPEFIEMARGMLEQDPDFRMAGTAMTGEDALRRLSDLLPDVLLVDLYLPGMNGFEVARRALALAPHLQVIVISVLDDPEFEVAARAVGALGFLAKRRLSMATLRAALQDTAAG